MRLRIADRTRRAMLLIVDRYQASNAASFCVETSARLPPHESSTDRRNAEVTTDRELAFRRRSRSGGIDSANLRRKTPEDDWRAPGLPRLRNLEALWDAFILTRPLGATVADVLDKRRAQGRLSLTGYGDDPMGPAAFIAVLRGAGLSKAR